MAQVFWAKHLAQRMSPFTSRHSLIKVGMPLACIASGVPHVKYAQWSNLLRTCLAKREGSDSTRATGKSTEGSNGNHAPGDGAKSAGYLHWMLSAVLLPQSASRQCPASLGTDSHWRWSCLHDSPSVMQLQDIAVACKHCKCNCFSNDRVAFILSVPAHIGWGINCCNGISAVASFCLGWM